MPDRNPDTWLALLGLYRDTLAGGLLAGGIAFVRVVHGGGRISKALLGGALCVLLAVGLINGMELVGLDKDKALLVGVLVGFIGADTLREWIITVVRKRFEKWGL